MNSELSERELQILLLVAQGLSNRQIAGQLDISDNTVKVHVRNIFVKINVASRTEASLYAVRHGLLIVENQPVAPAPIVEPPPLLIVTVDTMRPVLVPRWGWLLAAGVVVVIGGGGLVWWATQTPVTPVIRQQSSAPTRWARLPAPPNPQPDQQFAVYAGQLYAFTGNHGSQWLQFDDATRTWITLTDLPFVMPNSAKVWADGAGLWVVGSDDGRALRTLWQGNLVGHGRARARTPWNLLAFETKNPQAFSPRVNTALRASIARRTRQINNLG